MIGLANDSKLNGACLKVIGVGGGGGNAINNMIRKGLSGVDFIAANTDLQALDHNLADRKIQLGRASTRGLGAGANPEMGKAAVEESEKEIRDALEGADMVFITCGMGGGTGTGSAPTIARIVQEMGALTVAIVTKPFHFEGRKRLKIAEEWIVDLRKNVDALIAIPNHRLLEIIDKNTSFHDAFLKVDEVLYNATRGISDIIACHGYVNVDFADVQTVMKGMGDALMGIGLSSGENRAIEATEKALNSPLLDGVTIKGAKGLLVNITGGKNMTMVEISEAVQLVEENAGGNANLIHGVVYNDELTDELMVTVVATGFNCENEEEIELEETEEVQMVEQELPFNSDPSDPFQLKDSKYGHNPVAKSSPKGPNELKKHDEPAYLRKDSSGIKVPLGMQGEYNAMKYNKQHNQLRPDSKEVQNKPAFLRKIMD